MSALDVDPSLAPAGDPPPADPPPPVDPPADPPPAAVVDDPPPADPALVTDDPPPADPAADPPPARKPSGAVAELLENRRLLKEANARLSVYENDPAFQRMSPEMKQAVVEGRVSIRPAPTTADAEREHLTQVATSLGLFKVDATGAPTTVPDLEAAARVDRYVVGTVRQAVAPMQSMTLRDKAQGHLNVLWAQMAEQKMPADAVKIVEAEFKQLMAQPNCEQMLSQPEVVDSVYNAAIGKAFRAGKLAAGAPVPPKPPTPPANPSPPTGRRGPGVAAVQLSPQVAAVYAQHGIDPNKTRSATKELATDNTGAIILEP